MTPDPSEARPAWARWHHQAGQRLTGLFRRLDQRSGGLLSLLADTWRSFSEDDGGTRAAAIGYYGLFSLFPLTVLLALSLTYILGETRARIQVILIAQRYLPTDLRLVDEIVSNILLNRGTLSTLAVVGVSWGSVQIFRVLERAINRAWGAPRRRGFWRNLLFAVGMILSAGALTILSVGMTALFEFARERHLNLPLTGISPLDYPLIWNAVSALPPLALTMALFSLLYRYVPHRLHVRWRDVWPGALLASLLWEGAKRGFAFYFTNFARQSYSLLYGSLGAILLLLTWVYLTGYIILLGAEFCAVLSRHRREQATPPSQGTLPRHPSGSD